LSELNKFLRENSDRVSVISPIVKAKSLKGPTSKIMNELGLDVSVKTIASFYQEFAHTLFIDRADSHQRKDIESLGFKVFESDLIMNNLESKIALAKSIINYLEKN
jgi:LPPG:FO 2-phospho-L-lactate transferase